MKSVRKALRNDDLFKDTYQRLNCADCEEELKTDNDPEEVGTIRVCPECGGRWKEL
jgi:DNA-directed RNA polymerase subunit RPC12/RpoP